MGFPLRAAVYWRALEQSPLHYRLFDGWPEPTRLLFLCARPSAPPAIRRPEGAGLEEFPAIGLGHPAFRRLVGVGRRLDLFRPDCILCFDEPYCLQTAWFARYADRAGIPLVVLSCQNVDRPRPGVIERMERRVWRRASGAWFLNQEAQHRASRRGFVGASKVIPLGFDAGLADQSYGRRASIPKNRPFTVGYVGRLAWEKGVDVLVRACSEAGVRLRIAGDGPERREIFLRGADRAGADVEWVGRLTDCQVYEFYSEVDVLVLPSRTTRRWKEQFGRVLVEAMGCGVPVIGSDSGEIPRVIGEGGWITPEGDVGRLADAIRRAAGSPEELMEQAERGRRRAYQRFTWDRVGADLAVLVHAVMGAGTGGAVGLERKGEEESG